jgi:hypothetical protein
MDIPMFCLQCSTMANAIRYLCSSQGNHSFLFENTLASTDFNANEILAGGLNYNTFFIFRKKLALLELTIRI